MEQTGGLSSALAVLSAMITPAVLISACGTLALSTSNRLARAMDRTRNLSQRFRERTSPTDGTPPGEESALLYDQLDKSIARTLILHRALTALYIALGIFILTSVTIGVISVSGEHFTWLPMLLSFGGAGFLMYAATELIHETRVARQSIVNELDFILREGRERAPKDVLERTRRKKPSQIF